MCSELISKYCFIYNSNLCQVGGPTWTGLPQSSEITAQWITSVFFFFPTQYDSEKYLFVQSV